MTRTIRVVGGVVLMMLGVVLPVWAQDATIGFDVGLNSNYNWRGLSLTNKPVVQPDAWLSVYGFTGGVWANFEPTKYDGSNDLSESGGVRSGIAEIDYWLEYARSFTGVDAKVGWVAYTYNKNNAGIDNTSNTSEIYGQLSLSGLPVTPTLAAWYDIDKVKGLYVQGQLVYGVQASPAVTINLGVLAGLSAGQEVSANDPSANFAESGLTHVDFSASTSLAAGPVSIAPSFHFQVSRDPWTKINGADVGNLDKGSKIWFGVTLSWSTSLGATAAE
ncbi:MAG TPA: TorF family putative porin [Gemmatimonadales bacterium]|nr:TorF family putative porin [Gemmatimonadales bacterium]